jgi:hypothetical protein
MFLVASGRMLSCDTLSIAPRHEKSLYESSRFTQDLPLKRSGYSFTARVVLPYIIRSAFVEEYDEWPKKF